MSKHKNRNKLEAKKNAVLEQKKSKSTKSILAVCGILIAIGIIAVLAIGNKEEANTTTVINESGNSAGSDASVVKYPVSLFEDRKAKFFEYKKGNLEIKYFILKSSDDVIRAAFDACDVCWRAGKGYKQSGDEMVCQNCGRRFASVRINEVYGGCNPAPLRRRIENGNLVISVDDIIEGKMYFDI